MEKLTPIGKFMLSDFHALLVGQSKDELSRAGRLRKEEEIASRRDIFMLWYWRSRLERTFDTAKGMSVVDAIASTAKRIRRVKGDFAVRGIPFYDLTPTEKYMLGSCVKWRYHALEWVLNDESWYDTTVDT